VRVVVPGDRQRPWPASAVADAAVILLISLGSSWPS
jgi:hypothetical protein